MSRTSHPFPVTKFGSFALDTERRLLIHGYEPVALTPKQFDMLEYMVQNPGRLLTKQELLQAIWPDSFVEESNLSQNIFWLRKALRNGDNSDGQERYIVTVQGKGYRFVAPIAGDLAEKAGELLEDAPIVATPAARWTWQRWGGLVAAGTVCAAGLWLWIGHHHPTTDYTNPIAFPEVIVAQVQNATDDRGLTTELNNILRRGLSQSPFVTIVPRKEIEKTLGYMSLPLNTVVTSENAHAICLRRNATATIETSIVPQGAGFLLTLEAVNCVTGKAQSVGRALAEKKESVLTALDSLLPQLRRDLGESASSVRQFSVPVENATTGSLEAFRAFLGAEDLRMKGETVKAVPLFLRALQLDPNFALAHLGLGTCYQTMGEREQSIAEFTRAYELANRTSPREHLYIGYFYTKIALGDLVASLKLNDEWIKRYPRDPSPYTNGTDSLNLLDRFQDAIALGESGLKLFPDAGLIYVALGTAYLRAGHADDMKRIGDKAIALKVDGWQLHELLWQRAWLVGDAAAAKSERASVDHTPDEYLALGDDALVALQQGKVKGALAAQKTFLPAALANNAKDAADTNSGKLALALGEMGLHAQAETALRGKLISPEAGLALAMMGDDARAQAIVAELEKSSQQDTLARQWQLPLIRAATSLHKGTDAGAQEALTALSGATLGLHDFTAEYLRGTTYLKLGKAREARDAFQHIVGNQGADPFSPVYPLAVLGMARAQAMAGDAAGARASYQRLLQLWSGADETPAVLAAKAELAKLR